MYKKYYLIGRSSKPYWVEITNYQSISKKSLKNVLKKLARWRYKGLSLSSGYVALFTKTSYFITDLSKILPHCWSFIDLDSFILTQKDIQHILNNSFQWKSLSFSNCKLIIEDITISSVSQSKIKEIHMGRLLFLEDDQWVHSPYKIKNLIKAISESSIKKSLKKDINYKLRNSLAARKSTF